MNCLKTCLISFPGVPDFIEQDYDFICGEVFNYCFLFIHWCILFLWSKQGSMQCQTFFLTFFGFLNFGNLNYIFIISFGNKIKVLYIYMSQIYLMSNYVQNAIYCVY